MRTLDPDACYRALRARDARFDGRFFTGVVTTGVYCRPVCAAKTPRRENVRFFACAAAAEAAGFRPCLRCRPDASPGTPAWTGTSATVARALRLIEAGALDQNGVDELAARLGVTARHLRRLFVEHLGAAPVAVAQARRVHFARALVDDTRLPITDIAHGSGFASVRRFNHVFKRTFTRSPSDMRRIRSRHGRARSSERATETGLALRLAYREPFDWESLLAFLAPRAIPGIERVQDGAYRRVVVAGAAAGEISATRKRGDRALVLSIPVSLAPYARELAACARRLFDLAADPAAIAAHLAEDTALAPLIGRNPGARVPRAWNPFETAVRVVLGQQVSVRAASTLAGRLVEKYGTRVKTGSGRDAFAFPSPETLGRARLHTIGLTTARAHALRALAAAVARDQVRLDGSVDLAALVERLTALPGVGPWTAHMIAMRACGEPDAFPRGDLGLAAAARSLRIKDIEARAERWRPWRAYATMWLWQAHATEKEARKDTRTQLERSVG